MTPTAYTVTSFADDGSAGTLRSILATVNGDPASAGDDTITFAGDGTVTLTQGQLEITRPSSDGKVTIDGGGHAVTISGNNASTVISVGDPGSSFPSTVVLNGLTITGGNGVNGGGIYNDGGTLTVTASTITGNSAQYGGGIFNGGTLTVTASTITGNTASAQGGGIFNGSGAALTITDSTITGNSANQGGGVFKPSSATLVLGGSIVSGNTATSSDPDISGSITTDNGYNLLGTGVTSTGTGNVSSNAPLLAPLGNYGGPTRTMPLLPGSRALDAGDPTDNSADQRGVAVQNGRRDIGAFESHGFVLAVTGGNNQTTGVGTTFTNPLVVSVTANDPSEPVDGGIITFTSPSTGAGTNPVSNPAVIASGAAHLLAGANASVGSYTVTASAGGNPASTAAIHLTNTAATTVTVTPASVTIPATGGTVPLHATLTGSGGIVTGGTVTFTVRNAGGQVIGSPVTAAVANGAASANFAIPAETLSGTYTVTAAYTGSGGFLADSGTGPLAITTNLPGLSQATAVGGPNGTVTILNPDGSVAGTLTPFPGFTGETRTSIGTDGSVVAGTGPGVVNQVKKIDPATQAVVFSLSPFETSFTGGVFTSTGDLLGQGAPQVIVTPDQGGGPRVLILNGQTGAVEMSFFGIDDPNFRGGARTAVADVTGDHIPDLIVAAGFGGGPRVTIYDGAALRQGKLQVVANLFVFEQTLRNGVYVTAGDLDGDGYADLIVGGGPGGGPRVFALSGKDLTAGAPAPAVLANFFAGDTSNRDGVVLAAKNLDGDQYADLVTVPGPGGGTRVTAYAGKDIQPNGTPPVLFSYDVPDALSSGVFLG